MYIYRLVGTLDNLDPITPDLWDAGCEGLSEDGGSVLAYFPTQLELPFGGTWQQADNTDWVAAYRASIVPVQIGQVTITPPWLVAPETTNRIQIILEPGLAFGTGQHETTRMAIEALQTQTQPLEAGQTQTQPLEAGQTQPLGHKKVLDVGAGTGILAIVAAKLGAQCLGVDNDPSTVGVARENAAQNGVNIEFIAGLLEDVLPQAPFDLVVANLFAELHAMLMPQYKQALSRDGRLILTGILAGTEQADSSEKVTWDTSSGREVLVLAALEQHGFKVLRRQQLGDWVLLEAGVA
ncbi:MAG: 50S ribosomal protein L11 methyltransferase [Deinococcales bacterium]